MFKRGDVVYYHDNTNEVGVVDDLVANYPGHIWVNWIRGADKGERLHCGIDDITLLYPNDFHVENTATEYSVAELKKLLDKMDDEIVFSFSDLKIGL